MLMNKNRPLRRSRLSGCLTALFLAATLSAPFPCVALAQQPDLTPPSAQPANLLPSLQGTVTSPEGAVYEGVLVTLTQPALVPAPQPKITTSDANGHFLLAGILPGPYILTLSSAGFSPLNLPGTLLPAQQLSLPPAVLSFATITTDVRVTSDSRVEVAQQELHDEIHQHVLGVIPNFYVVYDHNAPPLTARQKFQLAWRSEVDPIGFLITGAAAGVEQAGGEFKGYGEGAQGYGKRFAAAYADDFIGNMIGGAVLPSIFHQDPRYLWKGSGTVRSRIFYAIANAVICKGDNGHWQLDYSAIVGNVASAAISNLYYPASDRQGVALTARNSGLGFLGSAVGNIFQEFVARRFTPKPKMPQP